MSKQLYAATKIGAMICASLITVLSIGGLQIALAMGFNPPNRLNWIGALAVLPVLAWTLVLIGVRLEKRDAPTWGWYLGAISMLPLWFGLTQF